MSNSTSTAIIFVPGGDSREKGVKLDFFVNALKNGQEIADITIAEVPSSFHTIKKLNVNYHNGNSKTIEVLEAFWGDLRIDQAEDRPLVKFFKSTLLVFYWVFSGVWSKMTKSKYLVLPIASDRLLP